ncbi:MAG: 4Fe-4S binding protein [Candidatus Accumulibacter sp.]|nr:4Fe-4S binding protein [Accumulibacter sp.]
MAMKIIQAECTSCGDCKPVCPTSSITSKAGMYKINVDTCTECEGEFDSPQCLDACPAGESWPSPPANWAVCRSGNWSRPWSSDWSCR